MKRLSTPLLLALAAGAALAQTVPDAGQLLQQQRQDSRPLQPPGQPPKLLDAPTRPTVDLPEGTAVRVTAFRITGARSYPAEQLEALVKPWIGRTLDLKGLNEAAGALTRLYQSGGHLLSYAYLPAQKVDGGVIEIAVLEGKVDAVQVVTAQEVRLRDEVVQAHTEAVTKAQPVLQAEVERKLLLLNDMPGVVARAAFTPGASTGTADVVVSIAEDEPLALRVEADNHGSRSSGEYRAGLQMQLRDVSGWGDSTTLRATVSNGGGLVSGSIATQWPLGGDGLRLGASLSRLTYALAGKFDVLGASGVASTLGLDARWPWLRSPQANVWLRGALEYKRLNDEIVGIGLERPRQNHLFDVGLDGDLRDGLFGGGSNVVAATLSMGDLRYGSAYVVDDLQRRLDIDRPYKKATLQIAREQALPGGFSLYGRWLGQYSGGNLDSAEKLGLSGPGGVRAYAPGEATADHGRLWSLELRYGVDQLGGRLQLSLFHDRAEGLATRRPLKETEVPPPGSGVTFIEPAPAQRVELRGTGFGLQWTGGDYGVSASMAWRGGRQPQAEGGDPKPRLYIQLFATP
jgi:hemolysin activation/secretion protein